MNIKQLTPFLSVSDQLTPQDLGSAAAQGFKAIVNNRPDREQEDQPTSAEIAAAAEGLGLTYRHIPVVSGKIVESDVEEFARTLAELKGPVLAFCRTGTRSTSLWALAEAPHLDPDVILKVAAHAGYNLDALKPRLEHEARKEIPAASRM